jgi:hypothetical protein
MIHELVSGIHDEDADDAFRRDGELSAYFLNWRRIMNERLILFVKMWISDI